MGIQSGERTGRKFYEIVGERATREEV